MFQGIILFDVNNPIFKDHFPGFPVVPGSFIIRELYNIALNLNLNVTNPLKIEQFKFKTFLRPGEYKYKLIQTEWVLKCFLEHKGKTIVSGVIL